jgi:hypothetical protein
MGSYVVPEVVVESSLAFIDPQEVTDVEEPVTFSIVGKFTIRGCDTLVDSILINSAYKRETVEAVGVRCAEQEGELQGDSQ